MADASGAELRIIHKASALQLPVNGSLELSPVCNMNCDMCYIRLSREEAEQRGGLRTAEEWLRLGAELRDAGVLFLLLTGGEPLLYPGFREVYLGLREMGFILTVNTNGTLLDENWADFFREHPPRRMNITLYGGSSESYGTLCHYPEGYEKTVRAVERLRERGVDVRLGNSLTRANYKDLDAVIDTAERLKVPLNVDAYMTPATRERGRPFHKQARLDPESAAEGRVHALQRRLGDEFLPTVAELVRQAEQLPPGEGPGHLSCLAGSCSFTVNWQGELRPCVIMTEPAVNVFETGFKAAWQQLRTAVAAIESSPRCNACRLRTICHTCAASAMMEEGSFSAVPEYLCRYGEHTYRLYCDALANAGVTRE